MLKKIFFWGLVCTMGLCFFCGCNSVNKDDLKDENNNQENISDEISTGTLHTLQQAYDKGYLSKKALKSIAKYLNEETESPEPLDGIIKTAIKETAAYNIRNREIASYPNATADGVTIVKYYGLYSGSYVVSMRDQYDLSPTDVPNYWEEIGGVQFHIMSRDKIRVWREK